MFYFKMSNILCDDNLFVYGTLEQFQSILYYIKYSLLEYSVSVSD
jgi:hypothetical protein